MICGTTITLFGSELKGLQVSLNRDFRIGRGVFNQGGALPQQLDGGDFVGDLGIAAVDFGVGVFFLLNLLANFRTGVLC